MMDRDQMLRGLLARLQYIVSRGRRRFDPVGCLFCGAPAGGALCATCDEMVVRLSERFPKPKAAPATDPPNLHRDRPADLNAPPREWLPYAERNDDDDAAS